MTEPNVTAELPPDPRDAYVRHGKSVRECARLYKGRKGCSEKTLMRRYGKEKWKAQREEYVRKLTAESDARAIETEAKMRARLQQSYSSLGGITRRALAGVVADMRLGPDGKPLPISNRTASALRSVAQAMHIAHQGERSLVDPTDDRVSEILRAAAAYAQDRVIDVEDWDPEEELAGALVPKGMADLSYSPVQTESASGNGNGTTEALREGVRRLTTPPEST